MNIKVVEDLKTDKALHQVEIIETLWILEIFTDIKKPDFDKVNNYISALISLLCILEILMKSVYLE